MWLTSGKGSYRRVFFFVLFGACLGDAGSLANSDADRSAPDQSATGGSASASASAAGACSETPERLKLKRMLRSVSGLDLLPRLDRLHRQRLLRSQTVQGGVDVADLVFLP